MYENVRIVPTYRDGVRVKRAEITVEDRAVRAATVAWMGYAARFTRTIPAQTAQGCAFDAQVYSAIRAREEAGGADCADYSAEIAQWAENRADCADAIWSNPRTLRCAYAQQKLDDAQITRLESDLLRYAARSTHSEVFG